MKKQDTLKFSVESLSAELNKYRNRPLRSGIKDLTKEQILFLKLGRDNKIPVSYSNLQKLWVKYGWHNLTAGSLANYCRYLRDNKWEVKP